MRIQHNIMAMNAYRNLGMNNKGLSNTLEKLSSGYRINRAGDDAAGLAISEKMRAQITGLDAAQKNVNDGISLVKTAEGALQEVQDMMNRMVELATQSANGTYDDGVDRAALQDEVNALMDEINRIADSANFNGKQLLDGSLASMEKGVTSVTAITTNDYKAAGPNDTFTATVKAVRPEAATKQTNASFTVSFDDITVAAAATGATNGVVVKIGNDSLTLNTAGASAALDGSDIAALFETEGYASGTAAKQTDNSTKVTDADTATWDEAAITNGSLGNGAYWKIDGNWYEASATGNTVTFTQVNYTGETGEIINPDFNVKVEQGGTGGAISGTTNWKVQNTKQGVGVGSANQAQAEISVDFSKLKDGDKLVLGSKEYTFKVGATGTATGANLIDLSQILKTEADLADADKQAKAMVAITAGMNGNTEWSVGNGNVDNGKGTLTLQSLSGYVDDANVIAGTNAGGGTGIKANMKTESSIMAQIISKGAGNAASVDVEFDVTKIEAGDTFTVNGTTFEFTDGTRTSDAAYIGIDLSAYNIDGGIAAYDQDNVMAEIKDAVETLYPSGTGDYAVSVEGDTLTITSKDDTNTGAIDESRTAATVTFGTKGSSGGLTLQIGDTADKFNQLNVAINDMHTKALKIDGVNVASLPGAQSAITTLKDAINTVSTQRGKLGAIQNRLEHTSNNLGVMEENIQSAESTIRDTDVADEMMAYTKNNILIQSAQAMLAQANQVPQGVLQLLG